jgi:hypothetical protein
MPGGTRPGAGRKPVRINLAELEKLGALQCTDEEIASFFGVSVRTVERRRRKPAFAKAIERGKAKGRLSLRRSLWALAVKGNLGANIFLAKNLLGYRNVVSNEHSGPGGGAIPIDGRPDFSRLSDAEFEQLLALQDKAQPRSENL